MGGGLLLRSNRALALPWMGGGGGSASREPTARSDLTGGIRLDDSPGVCALRS